VRRLLAAVALGGLVLLGVAGCGGSPGAAKQAASPARSSSSALRAIGAGVQGPAGYKATIYATGLRNVSAFAVDGRGRLWATTSAAADHAQDGVWLIPRAGARPVKVIADVSGPLGLTWAGDTLFVTSIGRVQAFSGLRGTRFARRRTILTEPAGHGWNDAIVALPDGRLAMGISSHCDHCATSSRWSGAIVSFERDGSDVKTYASHIRAPVGLALVPGTSDLLVSMNQRDDLGAKTPGDALALVTEGQDRRFPACYDQGGTACAGVPAPLALLDRHAAVGSIAMLGATTALVPEWALGKVQRVALRKVGDTYTTAVTPFLTGIAHPLAVATAGGAVFVGDWSTGRIYKVARG
jgi:glucose/arabinose dehydrogenase